MIIILCALIIFSCISIAFAIYFKIKEQKTNDPALEKKYCNMFCLFLTVSVALVLAIVLLLICYRKNTFKFGFNGKWAGNFRLINDSNDPNCICRNKCSSSWYGGKKWCNVGKDCNSDGWGYCDMGKTKCLQGSYMENVLDKGRREGFVTHYDPVNSC